MGTKKKYEGYVGVFDSGVGGISVLKALIRELPEEDFLFFGDSANAPYGEKSIARIRALSLAVADHLAEEGVKALVIACNTATSAAVREIRAKYASLMPVIGIEPALKPAAREEHHGKILVMATPATLKLEKYETLSGKLAGEAEFIPVACVGLASRIEKGDLDAPDLLALLEQLIGSYAGKVDGIVLGCTHYPFVKKQIRRIMGDIPMFDGGEGTARELHRQLQRWNRLRKPAAGKLRAAKGFPEASAGKDSAAGNQASQEPAYKPGRIVLQSSLDTPEEKALYQWLLAQDIS